MNATRNHITLSLPGLVSDVVLTFDDSAPDDDQVVWKTMNGTAVPFKSGEPAGQIGEKIKENSLDSPEKNTGRSRNSQPVAELSGSELEIRDGEDIKEAAIRYYETLRKNPVQRENFGTVSFTRVGRNKLISASLPEPERLKLLPAVKSLIERGDHIGRYELDQPRKDGVVAFHYFEGNVKIGNKTTFIGVSVGEDSRGNKFYNLAEDPDVLLAKKKARESAEDTARGLVPFGNTVTSAVNINIIPPVEEVKAGIVSANDSTYNAFALDRVSLRRKDENGYLHVAESALTKEQIAPYRGDEIPGWRDLGLDPDRLYHVYRPADELAKAVETFNGLPVLIRHQEDSAWNPQKALRVGTTGTGAVFDGTYLKNALVFHDAEAIDLIESGTQREISAGYRYTPQVQAGTFDGQSYDIVMTEIRGNHVAIVREGRAGPDVVVEDGSILGTIKGGCMHIKTLAKAVAARLRGDPKLAQDGDLEKVEALLTEAVAEVAAVEEKTGEPAVELDGQNEPGAAPVDPAKAEPAKDEDMTAKLAKLLAPLLEGKTEVAGKAVDAWLAELATALAAPAATDEGDPAAANGEENRDMAKDSKRKKDSGTIGTLSVRLDADSLAKDAALLAGNLERDLAARYRAKEQAAQDIKPLVGDVSAMTFDSAEAIYAYAVDRMGLKSTEYPGAALKGIVAGLVDARKNQVLAGSGMPLLAKDAKGGPLDDVDFNRFSVSG